MAKESTEDVAEQLTTKRRKPKKVKPKDFLSSGSTLLNLACTGRPNCGYLKGRYYLMVGDSSSGKTWYAHNLFAEAANNPRFDDYRLIFDDAEGGADMDVNFYFGEKAGSRIEPPAGTKDDPAYSSTVEEFYFNLNQAKKKGKPFIYVLDSMDAITTEDDDQKFAEKEAAYVRSKKTGKPARELSGSYGTAKARLNSFNLRRLRKTLRESGSILMIISQSRQALGRFVMEEKTRSGGMAMKFYATFELWTSVIKHMKKHYRGKDRELGIVSRVKVKKNRVVGRNRRVDIPIYHSFGIDDIGSCIDYLVEEKHWKKSGSNIKAKEFKKTRTKEELIKYIEKKNLQRELQMIVGSVWNDIEEACMVERKPRYS